MQGDYKILQVFTMRICKNCIDLLQFPNFSTYPMLWQVLGKKKQRTLGLTVSVSCHEEQCGG
jgi:hypothetical protein